MVALPGEGSRPPARARAATPPGLPFLRPPRREEEEDDEISGWAEAEREIPPRRVDGGLID